MKYNKKYIKNIKHIFVFFTCLLVAGQLLAQEFIDHKRAGTLLAWYGKKKATKGWTTATWKRPASGLTLATGWDTVMCRKGR